MSRAHSLDHMTFSQAAPSPPKVAFLVNRPLRGRSEDLVVEFETEGDERESIDGSPTSRGFLDNLEPHYTPTSSTSYGNIPPPSAAPPQSPKGSTFVDI
jgi:hypothetical protein